MKISRQEVEHVARLARLYLSEEERELFGNQLNQILAYMDKLNELDTSAVEPLSHILPIKNIFKEDAVRESLSQDVVLKNAPASEGDFFAVPRVVE